MMLQIKRTDPGDPGFISLVRLLDADLAIRDGEEHAFYDQFNQVDSIGHVVVACVEGTPVGCGAFKPFDENTVEIKRMFVQPELRGQGIAGAVLTALEAWAGELGYVRCVLETGKKQPEAIRLYEKSGYGAIPNFGQYAGVENSVCMEKRIPGAKNGL